MKNKGFCLPVIVVIFCMCASQGMPPGGPKDLTAPVIIKTIPEAGAINVPHDTKVSFYFDEAVNPQKASDAIFITPYQADHVKYRWRGKRLDIVFDRELKENRTYVITLGTGLRDYQGNAIDTSQTLAFSTGGKLDTCEIKGRILELKNARGVDVWAYQLEDSFEINPMIQEPEYVVQCSENGSFHFKYLAPGTYRIFGIKDRIADRLYQPTEDEIGIAPCDVVLNHHAQTFFDSLFFKMTTEDTLRPSLLQTKAIHQQMVMLRFSEPVSPVNHETVHIVNADYPDESLLIDTFVYNPKTPDVVYCMTAKQKKDMAYQVILDSLFDQAGNAYDSTFQAATFSGVEFTDTLAPRLMTATPEPGQQNVPLDQTIKLYFDEALNKTSADTAFALSDTSGNQVSGKFISEYETVICFLPEMPLHSFTTYYVKIDSLAGFDWFGNAVPDTVFSFKTLNKDTLSEISGRLIDHADSSGPYLMHAFQTGQPEIRYELKKANAGSYHFKNILPGTYFIEVTEDRDQNEKYTPGNVFPWAPSERVIQINDTIKVRSRWSNEGNDIQMPCDKSDMLLK